MRDVQATAGTPLTGAHRCAIRLFIVVAATTLLIDVVSKLIVVAELADRPPVRLLGGWLYLVHTRNTGAAFSLASGYTVILSIVAVVVAVIIVRIARRLASRAWALALGLILGGALGNLTDRIFRAPGLLRGGVVDFLSIVDPVDPPWPVFNLADSSLVIGVIIAAYLELRGRRIDGRVA